MVDLTAYGSMELQVVAIGNNITNTGKEAVVHGEYHYRDSGWPSFSQRNLDYTWKTISSITMQVPVIQQKCMVEISNAQQFTFFRASATLYNNVVKNNVGDALRIKGGIVNVQYQ